MTPEDLGVNVAPRNVVLRAEDPPARKAGIVVANVDELIVKLKTEAAVI